MLLLILLCSYLCHLLSMTAACFCLNLIMKLNLTRDIPCYQTLAVRLKFDHIQKVMCLLSIV